MTKRGLKTVLLILFSGSVWGSVPPNIPEEEIRKALSHTAFILSDGGICHGVIVSPYKVLTAAHCLEDIEADHLGDLRVAIFTDHMDPAFPTTPDFFEVVADMRNFMAECLIFEEQSVCSKVAGEFIARDDSWISAVDEESGLHWGVHIHQVRKIYIHPDYKKKGFVIREDAAVIVLKDPAPFHVSVRSFIENNSDNQPVSIINEPSGDDLKSDLFLPVILNAITDAQKISRKLKTQPLGCFVTDWRIFDSVYQQTQPLTFELFSSLMSPALDSVQEKLEGLFNNFASLKESVGDFDMVKEYVIIEQYKGFFKNERFAPQYAIDYGIQEGYSGGPLWCYSPETGLFLNGHTVSVFLPIPEVFFTRNFDEDLYQWVEELE